MENYAVLLKIFGGKYMKKLIIVLSMVMVLFSSSLSCTLAVGHSPSEDVILSEENDEKVNNISSGELTPASEKVIGNMSKKERKIAEYTDKYNDKTYAYTAYYLDIIQLYSIPICIIGLTVGAFNFYIIGEKKLDKREQGFGFIMVL